MPPPKISQILDMIDDNSVLIPAFQREYVWKRDDAKQLLDSLIKEYPTGTLLIWETTSPPELKGNHIYDARQGAVRILLDGQQRITTLYMLIKGELPPYYRAEEITHDTRGLFVNLETLELEYYSRIRMENDPRWLDITSIFKGDVKPWDLVKEISDLGQELSGAEQDKIHQNFAKIVAIKERYVEVQMIFPH